MNEDNFFQIFQLEESNIRGRVVRIGHVLDEILSAHDYPLPIAHLVAETISLSLSLSSMLKYEGFFTLQVQGDGPLKMIVSDVTSAGVVRACATFDEERFQKSREQILALKTTESSQNHLAQYLGKGYLVFTVDQGKHTERYQGIVELKGASMVDCVQHYFTQSEQIGTGIKMAVGKRDGKWRAGTIMMQNMPEDDEVRKEMLGNIDEDDWRRAMILLNSCTEDELLDEGLDTNQLLLRLFHEEGVRVYERKDVKKGCRCDVHRVKNVLYSMTKDDVNHMGVDGRIEMKCEFCSHVYTFDVNDVLNKMKAQ